LQRHADRRLRAFDRRARTYFGEPRVAGCAARLLPGRRRPASRLDRRRHRSALGRHQHDPGPRNHSSRPLAQEISMTLSRRDLVGATGLASGLALLGAAAVSGRVQAQSIPEAPTTTTNTMQPPLHPTSGPDYQPVVTLNGWTLPWRQNGD